MSNRIHQALLDDGREVVDDFTTAFAHGYEFDCGCVRVYRVDPITIQESERLDKVCKDHQGLERLEIEEVSNDG